jgi:methylenetetrahydrofolate reductase (NADPH)
MQFTEEIIIMKSGSNLEKILAAGYFAITAEIGPPKGADADHIRKIGRALKGSADAYNVTDCQTAVVRLCSLAGSALLLEEGEEPIMQMTCRDRNRIAMQSDVLGASALGVKNILALTGDRQIIGNEKEAKGVFDLDSVQEVAMLRKMRDEGKLSGGDELTKAPQIFIGAVENPFADPIDLRVMILGKKIAAGADFIQTQAIYDLPRFEKFMADSRERKLHKKAHILGGVVPLKSAKMARYMVKNIPGVFIPDAIIERMENAGNPKKEGIKICVETIEALKTIDGVHGAHIMAINWEEEVPEIVEKAGLLPRPTA